MTSKLALMMTSNFLHSKFHKRNGVTFSSIHPGCIAKTPLFQETRLLFCKYFSIFMKYTTGKNVSVDKAG
jgi:hypothetical protein